MGEDRRGEERKKEEQRKIYSSIKNNFKKKRSFAERKGAQRGGTVRRHNLVFSAQGVS